jgi:hypothetical protein
MKKLIAVSILLTLLSAAAFAQFKVELDGKFQPDLLLVTAPTGDAANQDKGTSVYKGTGTFDFLATYGTWIKNDLDVTLSYTDPDKRFKGLVQLNAEKWLQYLASGSYDSQTSVPTSAPATNYPSGYPGQADNFQSVLGFLNIPFGDWYLWGTAGIFTGYAGNTGDRGAVGGNNHVFDGRAGRFHDNFNSFVDRFKVDNYGIFTPFGGPVLDIDNLGKHHQGYSNSGNAYLSLTTNLDPIAVAVGADLGGLYETLKRTDPVSNSYAYGGGAFRVSGSGIADIVDFDVIYKLSGGDPSTDDKIKDVTGTNNAQPDGRGSWQHSFGLYANLGIIDGLGIGVGYSGTVRAEEDKKVSASETVRYIYPLLNGIDLRFKLSMIEKLTVTFNNNISFSAISNDDDQLTDRQSIGSMQGSGNPFGNTGTRDKEIKDSYLALYNALGVSYAITDAVKANLTLGNKLNTYNLTNNMDAGKEYQVNMTGDTFTATASALYSLTSNVKLEAGLAFLVNGTTVEITDQTTTETGSFTFGIPIRFSVKF